MRFREKAKEAGLLKLKFFITFLVVLFSSVSFAISFDDIKSAVKTAKKVNKVISKSSSSENDSEFSLRDKKVLAYLRQLVAHIISQRGLKFTPTIRVVNTEVVESYVMLDVDEIYISKGMLFSIRNEAQLVALIGHEIGHSQLKHRLRHYKKPVGFDVVGDILGKIDGVPDIVRDIKSQMEDIHYYQFSQNKEEEADEFGALVARDLGYNPYSFVDLFTRFSAIKSFGFISRVTSIKSSHKSLQGRAEHIKSYLSNLKVPNRGKTGEEGYLRNVGHLGLNSGSENYRADDELDQFISDLELKNKNHEQFSIQEFINTMNKLRLIAEKYGVLAQLKGSSSLAVHFRDSNNNFMKEKIRMAKPWWGAANSSLDKFTDALNFISRMGLGFIPVVGDAVDLYEVLTGKDFVSGDALGFRERLLSTLGVLVGSGQQWREVARGLRNIPDFIHAKIPGVNSREVSSAAKAAEKLAEEGNLYGRSKVGKTYNGHWEEGPLAHNNIIVDSFAGAKYTEIIPVEGEKFYRIGSKSGSYWSRVKPTSQIRSMSENAIHPDWNKFKDIHELEIPRNYNGTFYEGFSGNMSGKVLKYEKGPSQIMSQISSGSFFHGGGNQVYIPESQITALKDYIK